MITEDEMKEHIADLYAAVASLQELHRILDYAYKSAFKTDALFDIACLEPLLPSLRPLKVLKKLKVI